MEMDFESQKLPTIYKRNGRECYLDPIRQKLIYITPEETVRQKVIAYLINGVGVPPQMINVEEPLSHYGVNSRRRADIIVHGLNQEQMIPLAVIECKAPEVYLDERTGEQLADYCNLLGCDYGMMTNGYDIFCFHYDAERDEYVQLDAIPAYEDLLAGKFTIYDPGEFPNRIPYDQISDYLKENLDENDPDISCQTDHPIACAAENLWEGLLSQDHCFPSQSFQLFRVIKDYGVRILSYGNASGGVFSGPYRSLLIDVQGSTEFVSFGFSTYGNYSHPDIVKTALNVAIDNEKETHHSLQLVLDDNVTYSGNVFELYHQGKIGIGNKGSGKISELRELVSEKYPQIIKGKRFYLGSLIYNRDWNMDDPEVIHLLENLISYALIRDEYRRIVKSR